MTDASTSPEAPWDPGDALSTFAPASDAEVARALKLARFEHDRVLVTPASIGRLLRRLRDAEARA